VHEPIVHSTRPMVDVYIHAHTRAIIKEVENRPPLAPPPLLPPLHLGGLCKRVFWPYWPRRSNLRYTISIGQSLSLSISLSLSLFFSLALLRKKIYPTEAAADFLLFVVSAFQKPGQHSSAFHCVYLERYYYIRVNNSMKMMLPPGNSCNHTLDYIINIFGEKCDANEGGEQSKSLARRPVPTGFLKVISVLKILYWTCSTKNKNKRHSGMLSKRPQKKLKHHAE